jgi:hypothetical protein
VHTASGKQVTINKEQKGAFVPLGRRGGGYFLDSTYWRVTQDTCVHCKRPFELSARKLPSRPPPDDPHWPANMNRLQAYSDSDDY